MCRTTHPPFSLTSGPAWMVLACAVRAMEMAMGPGQGNGMVLSVCWCTPWYTPCLVCPGCLASPRSTWSAVRRLPGPVEEEKTGCVFLLLIPLLLSSFSPSSSSSSLVVVASCHRCRFSIPAARSPGSIIASFATADFFLEPIPPSAAQESPPCDLEIRT